MGGEGNAMPVVKVVAYSRQRDHAYLAERFMIGSQIGLAEVARSGIGKGAYRVLYALMSGIEYGNRIYISQKELAGYLGMKQSAISRAIVELVDAGFLERTQKRGQYVVSPRIIWKGRDKDLREALAARGMLDERGYMKEENAA